MLTQLDGFVLSEILSHIIADIPLLLVICKSITKLILNLPLVHVIKDALYRDQQNIAERMMENILYKSIC